MRFEHKNIRADYTTGTWFELTGPGDAGEFRYDEIDSMIDVLRRLKAYHEDPVSREVESCRQRFDAMSPEAQAVFRKMLESK